MGFASEVSEYRDLITVVHYCVNVGLAILIFAFGTMYLKFRDRRDQQRKDDRNRRDLQIKEWRDFAETIRREHNELKGKNVPSKISKVKNTFAKIQICEDINGTDVLRVMMRDPDYEIFKTTPLDILREDLDSVYRLLNRCASLTLLGTVPNNIRAELGKLITDLSMLTLPFYKEEERDIILKCLEHFGHFSSKTFEEVKEEVEGERKKDKRFRKDVPYVHLLKFGDQLTEEEAALFGLLLDDSVMETYEQCYKFRFAFSLKVFVRNNTLCEFLQELHNDLEKEKYTSEFADELRDHAPILNFIDKIDSGDPDELVVAKVLHEIRSYIHFIEHGPLHKERSGNVKKFMEIHERVTRIRPYEEIVRRNCERFRQDLYFLTKNMHEHHKSERFSSQFEQLYARFRNIIAIRDNGGPRAPPLNATVMNDQDAETSL